MNGRTLRADAAATLFSVLEQGQSLREWLPAIQSKHKEQDRAWLQEMIFGVLRQLPLLQFWLRQLLQKPLKGRQKVVEPLLLLGLYQLAFSRVSEHAAVAETVGACEVLKCPGLKGLVNACLRNFIRQEMANQRPQDPQIMSGLPKWLYRKLSQAYPTRLDDVLGAMASKSPIWLRINRANVDAETFINALSEAGIDYKTSAKHPDAVILTKGTDITALPGFQQGWFAAQDGAAQLAAPLLNPQPQDRILDACAAPGGKTCHLLEWQPKMQECVALDADQARLARVEENLQRLGHKATVLCGDATSPADWWDGRPFDRILLDAPCSATGVIRRHPDIKWLRKADDIQKLVSLQADILDAMWQTLAKGGTLLYATCSVLPEENREQIKAFLTRHQDAKLDMIRDGESVEDPGMQILPGEEQMDGFYYARLLKS
ncbi:16S rRNA (cytosine(967)-C(5))-methyltransferase RsmB [Aliiglaciecola sp. CAU 1673]|uniref:16S rRNA (cytosine(967)-C(5))-methyltransferase RsmB n=1 Tax=Aliiglaciecola sp. CAU 1673 TaxID=3032595 RepID=UPI0023D992B3|nr:16S rRNA (cytosine(967)-C(5))-methyltransferase RsmB [Aliiglaciecola sp. CAU 1673]MDF2179752.1 16S rRNA (cytosine(967)-C(5))-methyltransferase RsmB [Aliiglaciecola sp. CAU 1673]